MIDHNGRIKPLRTKTARRAELTILFVIAGCVLGVGGCLLWALGQ